MKETSRKNFLRRVQAAVAANNSDSRQACRGLPKDGDVVLVKVDDGRAFKAEVIKVEPTLDSIVVKIIEKSA